MEETSALSNSESLASCCETSTQAHLFALCCTFPIVTQHAAQGECPHVPWCALSVQRCEHRGTGLAVDFKNSAGTLRHFSFFPSASVSISRAVVWFFHPLFYFIVFAKSLVLVHHYHSLIIPKPQNPHSITISSPVDITTNNLLLLAHQRFHNEFTTIALFVIHENQTTIIRNGSHPT